MRKSPLIELLQVFSSDELEEFRRFVRSPYFNRGEFEAEAPLLLDALVVHAPDWHWDENTRRATYENLFGALPFVEGKLEKIMSVLHRLARQFVAVHPHAHQVDSFSQTLELLRFSRQRGLNNRFQNTMQKLQESMEKDGAGHDVSSYSRRLDLEFEQFEFDNLLNYKRGDINIPRVLGALNQYYHALRLDLLNRFLLQQKVTRLDIPDDMQAMLNEPLLPDALTQASPVLKMESAFLEVLKHDKPEASQFQALVDLIRDVEHDIKADFLKDYYSLLRSCCILLVNSGHMQYLPVLFEIQKDHLQHGYFYYDQKIPAAMFQNIINVALRVREFDWAYACIQEHANRIIGDNLQQDYFRFNLSNYYFHTGQYDQALEFLPHAPADLESQFAARSLELKIYYELDSELLPYKIDAYKMYLSRASGKLLPAVSRERNGNFVNLLSQLCNTRRGDRERVERLVSRIQAKTWVSHREWLLEKAESLAK
ncbi:MAG: hypothetical protein JNL02_14760 [Saprospiraceae bacterium]|nr:hypothetical protein [Saprospiraceae bacterium]